MASVVIAGDTSGQVTISAPAVAGTTTLTLPATTGTVLNDATVGVCRAWVNFNGTGTVAIRASFNVSSITDNGTGDYTVNFTTAMTDANYSPVITGGTSAGADSFGFYGHHTTSTGSYRARFNNTGGGAFDFNLASVAIFR